MLPFYKVSINSWQKVLNVKLKVMLKVVASAPRHAYMSPI